MHRKITLLAIAVLLTATGIAHAQYSWIGENGVRQFSDRPPPPSTPPHKILKSPSRAPSAPASDKPAAPAPAPGAKAAPTVAEREADYRERMQKRTEQEKKEAELTQRERERLERCRSALQVRAQVESGIRITNVDAQGERSVVTDEEKAAQLARANRVLAECR